MKYFLLAVLAFSGLFLLDRLCLWLERKGWLYYRYKKPTSGAGNALQELNAFLNPSTRHMIEAKQQDSKKRENQGEIQ